MQYVIKLKLQASLLFSGVLFFAGNAFALEKIICHFSWDENASQNIMSSSEYEETGAVKYRLGKMRWPELSTTKKVRKKEYNRLIEADKVDVRVSNKYMASCVLNHPYNTRIDVVIAREELRINRRNYLSPSCDLLNAKVECFSAE